MSDPSTGTGDPEGSAPTVPPPPHPPAQPIRPASPDHDRPLPHLASLVGAAAGLLLLTSLALFLSELHGERQRLAGFTLSLLFEVLGVALLAFSRDRRTASAGVALTALGVVPLLVFLFVDVRNPDKTIDDVGSFTSTATLILLVAAGLWLLAYLVGPGRRYGIYLGAALLAVWLVAVVQIVDDPLSQVVDGFSSTATFVPVGRGDDGSGSFTDDGFSSDFPDDFTSDLEPGDFESGNFEPNDFGPSSDFEDFPAPDDPSAELGWTSLAFGAAYLAGAAWRDRRGDRRGGTPMVAVAIPILLVAMAFLGGPLHQGGSAVLSLLIGAAAIAVGTGAGRRFTSWVGLLVALGGLFALVDLAVGDSTRATAVVLALLAAVLLVAAHRLEGPGSPPAAGSSGTTPDQPEGEAAPAPGAAPAPAPAPTADAWAPPAVDPGPAPPTFTPPPAPPGGSWPSQAT